jgi:hypothetical protein
MLLACFMLFVVGTSASSGPVSPVVVTAKSINAAPALAHRIHLPLVRRSEACLSTGQTYGTLPPTNPYNGNVETHPDMNLAVRGYEPTTAYMGLVDYAGAIDPNAPQFPSLFSDNRTAIFRQGYKVYRWDWTCNCRSGLIQKWAVTLLGLAAAPGEIIHLPVAGYDIGGGYGALVLYASPTRLTLKYTREDDVVAGYTIHLENICTDPNLLALYQRMDAQGRSELPALFPGQPLGRARSNEIDIAVRDGGSLLDPRSRKDWWQGR